MSVSTTTTPALARTVRGDGAGLLLVHGAGGGVEANYGPVLDGLAAVRRVVGADLPGTGLTPPSEGALDADELVDRLVEAADAEGLERFAVSGYSLGSALAVRLTARHPERVTALVLSAAFAHADTRTDLAAAVWHRLFESGQHELLAQYVQLMALSEPVLNSLTPAAVQDAARGLAPVIPAGTGDHVDLVRRIDVRADLARITVPTLVVVTTGDPLIAPGLQRQLAAAIPHAEVAELATGHLPFAERPQEWLELMTDFLSRV
ncbi:alpha/beta fold hydrolase [Streptomyces sp. NPDC089919]|uniref:alpha/beta fold hydrolase n=1 Tax=Streptomyces sp. NPDC089919 TaxID=3155188 RepID=UPI00341CC8D4